MCNRCISSDWLVSVKRVITWPGIYRTSVRSRMDHHLFRSPLVQETRRHPSLLTRDFRPLAHKG